jgi:hypothetical protein
MSSDESATVNKSYVLSVFVLTFVLPIVASAGEMLLDKNTIFSFDLMEKWFIFSAVGLRLFAAGIKQVADPAFTAKEIFQIDSPQSLPIVRELGFANLSFGLIGILSLFLPTWRAASAFGSGLYYGVAGIQHLIKKTASANEKFALITDIIIFIFLAVYFVKWIFVYSGV